MGIKKNFKKVAFIGPNPYFFLQHLTADQQFEKFYFCEPAEESVQKSHDIISERVENGFYDKLGVELPDEIIPVVVDEETGWSEHFKEGELDLIVSNMNLHWLNNLEGTFHRFRESLEADGALMATCLGGDTL